MTESWKNGILGPDKENWLHNISLFHHSNSSDAILLNYASWLLDLVSCILHRESWPYALRLAPHALSLELK